MTLEEKLKKLQEEIKQNPLTSVTILIIVFLFLLIVIPYLQVYLYGINNDTVNATLENQYRATFAQMLGGVAIAIGLYYTWRRIGIAEKELQATQENLKIAQDNLKVTQENLEATQKTAEENLKVSQEGQITERFTRAIDQLGNEKMEIRLGGIYALERISTESEKDYWPVIEILTAYVRKNSRFEVTGNKKVTRLAMDIQANESTTSQVPEVRKVSLDIQAILTVLGRRKNFFNNGEVNCLDLQETWLLRADLKGAHLEGAKFIGTYLESAHLEGAHLKDAYFTFFANLKGAYLDNAHLEGAHLTLAHLTSAHLEGAHLEGAHLNWANLQGANLKSANLEGAHLEWADFKNHETFLTDGSSSKERTDLREANLKSANLEGADLEGADLEGARNLSLDQLSKVKTLYNAELDEDLRRQLEEEYPALFEKPD